MLKHNYLFWHTQLLLSLCLFFTSIAFASDAYNDFRVGVLYNKGYCRDVEVQYLERHNKAIDCRYVDEAKMGEQVLLPIHIFHTYNKWESLTIGIRFPEKQLIPGVPPTEAIHFETITLDQTQQAPYTLYLPVTVTQEGQFDVDVTLHVQLPDGEKFYMNDGSQRERTYFVTLGIFAFEGKVYFARTQSEAIDTMARKELLQTDPDYADFMIMKEARHQMGQYRSLSETEKQQSAEFSKKFEDKWKDIRKRYREKHPESVKPVSRANLPLSNLRRGDTQTLQVNWATNFARTDFLPLTEAQIKLTDNDGLSEPIQGVLLEGEFSFTVPRDNYSFTAEVSAIYQNVFSVKITNTNNDVEIVRIGFQNLARFDIVETGNSDNNKLLEIIDKEVNAWSVFQAMVELNRLVPQTLYRYKTAGYDVYFANDNKDSYYCLETNSLCPAAGDFHISLDRSYSWDVIAHEFGHAIAKESNATHPNPAGGDHNGDNQYDYNVTTNDLTYHNKENALSLAFNEGFGHWFGVNILENSAYKTKMPGVGDNVYDVYYQNTARNFSVNLEKVNDTTANTLMPFYGEDAEYAIAGLLWDLSDTTNENNGLAKCLDICRDQFSMTFFNLYSDVFSYGNNLNISVFYENLHQYYNYFSIIDQPGVVNYSAVNNSSAIGVMFAEFGIAPIINENFIDPETNQIQQEGFMNLDNPLAPRPKIFWQQFKTGTMQGLDKFDLLIFNASKSELLHKIEDIDYSYTRATGTYSHRLDSENYNALKTKLAETKSDRIYLMLKAKATSHNLETGPYYSNAAKFETPVLTKAAVIAVDSSGSNTWTDPTNMRNSAANSMLKKMADRNTVIRSGTNTVNPTELPTKVAAIDFDDYVYILSNFAEPADLYQRSIFNLIDSWGGTDVAKAINFGVYLIRPDGTPSPNVFPNQEKIYLLTDMDNGTGLAPIIAAVQNAGSKKIPVNIGHLLPITTFSNRSDFTELRGDHSPRLTRIAEPMDALTEVLILNGGSYATITDPTAQQAWIDLMAELNAGNPLTRTEINIPLDIKVYGVAVANDGRDEPDYVYTADQSGVIKITVDGKGNFIPTLTVNGTAGTQTSLGNDLYEMEFTVTQGQTYRINLNEAASDAGLYNIMLQRISTFAAPGEIEPIPAMSAWFLISLIVSASSLVMLSRRKRR